MYTERECVCIVEKDTVAPYVLEAANGERALKVCFL
jgi:hypothetical protein